MSVNRVILIGNLGKDPEVKHLENGAVVANFPMATSESYKDKGGNKVDQTEWHNIVLWRGLAEVAEKYLKKGSKVYIEGKIKTRTWEDQEGATRYSTEIVGDRMTMLGGNQQESSTAAPKNEEKPKSKPQPLDSFSNEPDDLPF